MAMMMVLMMFVAFLLSVRLFIHNLFYLIAFLSLNVGFESLLALWLFLILVLVTVEVLGPGVRSILDIL